MLFAYTMKNFHHLNNTLIIEIKFVPHNTVYQLLILTNA